MGYYLNLDKQEITELLEAARNHNIAIEHAAKKDDYKIVASKALVSKISALQSVVDAESALATAKSEYDELCANVELLYIDNEEVDERNPFAVEAAKKRERDKLLEWYSKYGYNDTPFNPAEVRERPI